MYRRTDGMQSVTNAVVQVRLGLLPQNMSIMAHYSSNKAIATNFKLDKKEYLSAARGRLNGAQNDSDFDSRYMKLYGNSNQNAKLSATSKSSLSF